MKLKRFSWKELYVKNGLFEAGFHACFWNNGDDTARIAELEKQMVV
jgi:hypothetical protein